MTRARVAITKTALRQRIEVLTAAGLGIAAIRPDGTIIVGRFAEKPDTILLPEANERGKISPEAALEKWLETNAKG
jgi:hypothetical protein